MSAGEKQATEPEATAVEPEPRQMGERTAKAILTLVATGAVWGLVAAFPWIAYVIVGILGTHGWQAARRWIARRRHARTDEPAGEQLVTEVDVVQALHFLAAPNVFLSALAAELDLSMEAARTILEGLGVRVRRAVRVGDTTGVGVHADDIPPLPQPLSDTPVDCVDQGQPTNQQGVRIERTDGGFIVYDLADTHRHHPASNSRTPS